MPNTNQPTERQFSLPPIALSQLKEPTKDYLLACANSGKTPTQAIIEGLDERAEKAGFKAAAKS